MKNAPKLSFLLGMLPALLGAQVTTFVIDFGISTQTTEGWVNFTEVGAVSGYDLGSGVTLAYSGFTDVRSHSGLDAATAYAGFPYPGTAQDDFFTVIGASSVATVTFSGLDPDESYDIVTSGNWKSSYSSNWTIFSVTGLSTSPTQTFDVKNNISTVAQFDNIFPDASGMISISYRCDSANSNKETGITMISLSGVVSAVPEPSTFAALGGLLALGFVMVVRRRRQR